MIISFLNQKGGVGKTTLAVHLATALARRGARVLMVDADPQGSGLDWSASRTGDPLFPVIGLPKPTIHRELPTIAADYAHVVIDGPPPRLRCGAIRDHGERSSADSCSALAL